VGRIMMTSSMIPIPPIQCVILLQKSIALGILSISVSIEAPVVVNPDTLSNKLLVNPSFSKNARPGDIIIAGDNFGCGSSREHPSVGLAHLGVRAVIIKSVNRIFYRSSINQGLPLIVHREAVEAYTPGDTVEIDFDSGIMKIGESEFRFEPLPPELKQIIEKKGLVNWIRSV